MTMGVLDLVNKKVNQWIEKCINILLWIAGIFFLIGTIITFINALARKLIDESWTGMEDFNAIMLMTLVYLPLVYLEWHGKHLSLSLFVEKLKPSVRKIIKKIEHAVILFFSLIIFKGTWDVVYMNMQMGTKLASIQIPVYIPYSVLLVGFGLIIIVKFVQLFVPEQAGDGHVH
jgi:TRAP-type C4-dicarboxylate transport system permease small subunit